MPARVMIVGLLVRPAAATSAPGPAVVTASSLSCTGASGHPATYSSVVAEEWRLSIDFTGHPGAGKRFYCGTEAREVLRGRFGDDIVISAEKARIFLYTGRAGAAREAELAARQVLAQQGLSADVRLDRWDPSDQVWRDARSDVPEHDAGPLPADAGNPGYVPMPSAAAEALATMIVAGVDVIGLLP